MKARGALVLSALCATLGTTPPAHAKEIWSRGDASLSLGGTLRQIGLYTRQTDPDEFFAAAIAGGCTPAQLASCPAFDTVGETDVGQGSTRIRIDTELRATHWLYAVVAYDNELRYGLIDTLEAQLGTGIGGGTFLGAEGVLDTGPHHDWHHSLYRGYLRLETRRFELGVGRQRVAWGVGRLWTPIDRFSDLPPLSLQPDVTPGIDGLEARYNFDGFTYLQLVFAPGRSRNQERWALRLHGVLLDADLSLMGGMFEEAPTVGFDFARNLWDAAVRFEAVFTSPEHEVQRFGDPAPAELPDFWQIVVSADINLEVGTGVYLLGEYLYNGNALGFGSGKAGSLLPFLGPNITDPSVDIFGSSRVVSNAAHQLGLQTGYDITPELRGDVVTLIDMDGGSAAFFPNLRYSPLDSLELTLGVQLFAGPRRSQYGFSQPLVFLLADLFF